MRRPPQARIRSLGARIRHPLWWLPDPALEQDEAYRRVWQNLRQVTEVRDGRHDGPEWRSHEGRFALCCVRVPTEKLSHELAGLRSALAAFPFVRLHPDAFLHIPIQELGFVTGSPEQRDELTPARLQEFIGMAEHPIVDFPRFEIALGGVNSFIDAAFLDVHDGGWLSRIHRRLLDFVVIPPDSHFPFLPHVTIAHYTKAAPVGNLPAILADWRDRTFGSFEATHVEIVLLDTSVPYPELETVHAFELGARSRSMLTVTGT
ncbi:MAG: hypothetical protein AVDCRST_MAG87-2410 [uncultured Thermomicrobiales bacterium]|uniref:2'-5' RNA ligase family protein n=1 Tax=uncultured Thermomicrobiales bacterium TaxID=1645740 RepID=A0A6J4V9Q0_9BACT|nr:MAG: hypothetical protein AVDCRST_MAG87-2410 [uncultured Thermomicrobiales bacterium]